MNIIPYNIECRENFYYYYDSAVTVEDKRYEK